jgi:uncharacterized protein (DUF302 family)
MRHALLIVTGLLAFAPVAAQSQERVDLQSRSFMVVARADHLNMLRMVGANTRGALTIMFGKPDMMKTHLPAHPEIGLEMPMRIYVGSGRTEGRS